MAQILNKPTIVTPIQSDWNQATTSALDFIKNKPTIITQTNVDNSITNALAAFKVEVFNKNTGLTLTQFELDNFVNTSYDRNVTTNITLTETSASSALTTVATICTVGYTNTSGASVTITIPSTGNNKSMMENTIVVEAGKYLEVAMKGSGTKRIWTYLKQK